MIAKLSKWVWLATLLVLATTTAACASPFKLSFTAYQFIPLVGADPAPDDPVYGTLFYDASSINSPINSLTAISLTIVGHTYVLGEVGFLNDFGIFTVGGLIDGVGGSGNFEDDFVLIWDQTHTPLLFQYSAAGMPGIWYTNTFSQFIVTDSSAVPEPGTLALLGLAISVLIPISRKRRRQPLG